MAAKDVQFFANCSVVLGGLSLMNLAPDLDTDALQALRGITKIAGPLRVIGNFHLTSLDFLSNVTTVDSIVIGDNRNLVDARLPRLGAASLAGAITQTLNPRLCPSRSVGGAANASVACAVADLVLQVACRASTSAPCVAAIAAALNSSVSSVNFLVIYFCSFQLPCFFYRYSPQDGCPPSFGRQFRASD